jgi:succinyl-CoA synthetase beta subunit
MRLLEFQAKRIFSEHGIPIPRNVLLESSTELESLPYPVVLKAQVPVGGRGKAGAIKPVTDANAAAVVLDELLNISIRGNPVRAVLAEEKVEVQKELYLALLIDKLAGLPVIIASDAGGVDIEQVDRESPEQIVKKYIDPSIGLSNYTVRYLAKKIGVEEYLRDFVKLAYSLFDIFQSYDGTLVEINPLAVTANGLLALDAKIVLDDKAAYRHGDLFGRLKDEQTQSGKDGRSRAEQLAEEKGITYVSLDGNVGMISDGAGTGMLTLDLIQDAGGRAANFCELGGFGGKESMQQALEVVLANPRVEVLLISLIGGLTRMDEVADGIVAYLKGHEVSIPLVVRMCGTQEEAGRARLQTVGIEALDDLPTAIRTAVDTVKGS